LVGVSHPGPGKTLEFQSIDRTSALGAIEAARHVGIEHFVYVSVAQPAPVMRSYVEVRVEARRLGLVTLNEMTGALLWAVENPALGVRLVEVPEVPRGLIRS
jgi:uncharacterized protein YbjT (DUF2867 family)